MLLLLAGCHIMAPQKKKCKQYYKEKKEKDKKESLTS